MIKWTKSDEISYRNDYAKFPVEKAIQYLKEDNAMDKHEMPMREEIIKKLPVRRRTPTIAIQNFVIARVAFRTRFIKELEKRLN